MNRMKDIRRARGWILAGIFIFALIATVVVRNHPSPRPENIVDASLYSSPQDMRDAVASLVMTGPTLVSRKTIHSSWFKVPQRHQDDMNEALLSSRRKRTPASLVDPKP